MAEQTLVDEIQKLLEHLRETKGDFLLVMLSAEELYAPYVATAGWNFIVSAPWADELTIGQAVKVISDTMAERLSKKSLSLFSRITVLKTSDPLVQGITSAFAQAPGLSSRIVNCNFAGIEIPYALILQAQREVRNARVDAK